MLKKLAFKRKIDQKTIIISLIKKILTNSKNDSNNEHNKNPLQNYCNENERKMLKKLCFKRKIDQRKIIQKNINKLKN